MTDGEQEKALVPLVRARRMLAEATTIEQIMHVANLAQRAADFAKAANLGLCASNQAKSIELDARRKAGDTLVTMKARGELARRGKPKMSQAATFTVEDLGLTRDQSARYQQEASVPNREYQRWKADRMETEELSAAGLRKLATGNERTAKEAKRQAERQKDYERVKGLKKFDAIIETGAKFSTIALDPPWDWGDEGDCDQLGRAKPTYATMPFDQLLALPIDRVADKNAHLYLWITNRSLPKGFALLEKWEFRYITTLTWCKPSFGMGNYFRGQTEHVLFGVKGSLPLKRKDAGTWFAADRGPRGHSSKPEEFYALVESCSPGPYMERFARDVREGWVCCD